MKRIFFLLIILLSVSCKKEKEIPVLSINQVENLGLRLENKVEKADIKEINKLYDIKTFMNLFLMKSTKKRIHEFNAGFFASFSRNYNFGEMLVQQKSEGSSYNLVRTYQDENKDFHLLFRHYGGGLNYHDFLVKMINGEPKIIDMYIYMSGENLSDTYRAHYKNLLQKSNLLSKDLVGTTLFKDFNKLNKIKSLNIKGQFKKAHKLYQTVSYNSRQNKSFKLVNLLICSNLTEELYKESIKDYEERFPNDPSLYLISLDGLILRKEFDKCLIYIDKLEELLGGDPFLNFLRGNIYYFKKDYDNALGKFAIMNLEYPEFFDAYDSALGIYIERKQYKKALEILDLYITDFKMDKNELKLNMKNASPDFIKTKEYRNWASKK
ncbi:tetratricopeptide repeat protein [Polaribacter porphyrae]|uniref:Tetratricopeptide repeat protein n=1 Tax=Polaribacter porphyrae TaxID=1137780 RepID=A0A2S7WKU3_9FLAO|nr:hypothetical protein [Polaribacter porphyrae]PQJ78209.1 hypothetical protein BTO18_02935 [Polaribacter porphyrae]